jgi:hypothetical protein
MIRRGEELIRERRQPRVRMLERSLRSH